MFTRYSVWYRLLTNTAWLNRFNRCLKIKYGLKNTERSINCHSVNVYQRDSVRPINAQLTSSKQVIMIVNNIHLDLWFIHSIKRTNRWELSTPQLSWYQLTIIRINVWLSCWNEIISITHENKLLSVKVMHIYIYAFDKIFQWVKRNPLKCIVCNNLVQLSWMTETFSE